MASFEPWPMLLARHLYVLYLQACVKNHFDTIKTLLYF